MRLRRLLPLLLLIPGASTAAAPDEVVAPGENLVTEGIPRIPRSLADEIRPYTEFRGAGISDWHPARREMLIYTQFADTTQVHNVKFPGGARTQLTFFREPVGSSRYQPTRGDFFVFSRDAGGNEQHQKYRFDSPTGAVTLLTDGKSRNTGGVWSNAGDTFAYASTRRNGQDVDLWVMNPADPKSDKMLAQLQGGGWEPLDFSPDDRQLLVTERVSANESYLWIIDVSTASRTPITPRGEGEKVSYGDAQFSRDGKGIYVTTDRDSEFHRLAYVALADGRHTYLTDQIKWDVSSFQLSWDGRTIALITNEDGLSILRLLDTATGKELPRPEIPVGLMGGLRWHRSNRDLGFSLVDSRRGSDAYCLDVSTGKLERWTFSETGGVNTDSFLPPELVHWQSFDGRTLSGWLNKPPARFTGKRPVVIRIHGGPEGQARPWIGAGDKYLVNELGIVILQPNVRGSSGYGKTFLTLDNGFKREDSYKDIGALLDWIKTQPGLDAERIMVTGGSYGGHMTLAIATRYPDRIRCALDVVGMSNLVTFLENTSAYRRDLRRVEYGDERDPKMREFLTRIAPMNHAKQITKPLFVVQGGNDPRVPLSESVQLVETLKKQGTPVWYLMAKDEGHGFAKKPNEDFLLYATVMFVRQHLLN
jgi:dipeptidyl aminopeptidase/acylaminoacyl peptidase